MRRCLRNDGLQGSATTERLAKKHVVRCVCSEGRDRPVSFERKRTSCHVRSKYHTHLARMSFDKKKLISQLNKGIFCGCKNTTTAEGFRDDLKKKNNTNRVDCCLGDLSTHATASNGYFRKHRAVNTAQPNRAWWEVERLSPSPARPSGKLTLR